MERLLKALYGLDVINVQKSYLGAGSDTWFLECRNGKYVLKYPAQSDINHPEFEPELCEYLNERGVPVCCFLKNREGNYLSHDETGQVFHVQVFFEGMVYDWNCAPDCVMTDSARVLGQIHNALKDYPPLPTGIGKEFFQYMTPAQAGKSYENSLKIARQNDDKETVKELEYRFNLMKRFPHFTFDMDRLTCRNTHGDYFISQFICGEQGIRSVIDWTTACVHPVVWELVRSYVYASPKCANGNFDETDFWRYVDEYRKEVELTEYDMEMALPLYLYQIAVCDYYGQYYAADTANSEIYLQQAKLATKLLYTMDKNGILWRKLNV